MNTNTLDVRTVELLQLGEDILRTRRKDGTYETVDIRKLKEFRTASLSFIEMVYRKDHSYYKEFDGATAGYRPFDVEAGIGIMQAIRREINGGWLTSVKGLITAEVFSDFFEMAEHLLVNDYKDAAAVIAGSTLEEHLRQLCLRNSIETTIKIDDRDVPKKADALNSDLGKANIYNKLDQKNITAWLDLRNKAAHGAYDEYNKEQVKTMLSGVGEFCARTTS